MKTIKLTQPHRIDNVQRKPGDVVLVVDQIADKLIRMGHAQSAPPGQVANPEAIYRAAEGINPLLPNADPMHAARALGSTIEDHPGLVALGEDLRAETPRAKASKSKAEVAPAPTA